MIDLGSLKNELTSSEKDTVCQNMIQRELWNFLSGGLKM